MKSVTHTLGSRRISPYKGSSPSAQANVCRNAPAESGAFFLPGAVLKLVVVIPSLLAATLLAACAGAHWENPGRPEANFRADLAQCQQDAERVSRLSQTRQVAEQTLCIRQGVDCMPLPENQNVDALAAGQGMVKRCLAHKGWQAH